jgi:predicted nucleotidyltransferase
MPVQAAAWRGFSERLPYRKHPFKTLVEACKRPYNDRKRRCLKMSSDFIVGVADLQKRLSPIFTENKVSKAAIFGSYARDEQQSGSDIDFLVKFESDASLLDLGGLFEDLKDALQTDIDIVTCAALENDQTEFAKNVLREARVIYDAN